MTALNAAILFNNSTGSDTTASGCGAATAVTITLQTSAGSNTANASGSLSSISAGDLMYVPSFTGRKFNVIASVQPLGGTITFDDNWDDSASGVSGYVGGKRATFDNADSRLLFGADAKTNFIIETETDQSISSVVNATQSDITVRGDNQTVRTITQTSDAPCFSTASGNCFEYLKFQNTNASKTNAYGFVPNANYGSNRLYRCVFGDATNQLTSATFRNAFLYVNPIFMQCLITDCTSDGIGDMRDSTPFVISSIVANNGDSGVEMTVRGALTVSNSVFANNTTHGCQLNHTGSLIHSTNCIYYGNGQDGINSQYIIGSNAHNIFVSNGRYGMYAYYGIRDCYENAFYNNTTADAFSTNNFYGTGEENQIDKITLTADPFVDPTASPPDFNISDSAGGGDTLRATNFSINTDTAVYPFRQYVSDAFGAGGSGAVLHPLRSN